MDNQARDLGEIRKELDHIDRSMVELFQERMKLCGQVAKTKISSNRPVRDLEREKSKLETLKEMAEGDFNKRGVEELFIQIMAMSRKLQYGMMTKHGVIRRLPFMPVKKLVTENARILYQGVEGAYSQAAAIQFFGEDADFANVKTWEDAMNALSGGRADYAVLPIENSSAGMVGDVYDLLVKYDNYIVGETEVKVEHALLGLPESGMEDIRVVYSHPQGLMQCSKFLSEHKDWEKISTDNTAGSAKKVLEDQDISQAAIASERAGKLYGLKVLKAPINFNAANTTRFVILSSQKIYREDAGKVSICFETAHESGALYNMLSHFIYNNLNMTKIESRPMPGRTWEYRFFVDFEGNLSDPGVQNAIMGISEEAASLKILGNY
ncbi:prephenate dehydratase [Lachnotalea sp. AF33-28]|uniref:prephenate dehydratase n=1 Tax=Lachnotalea sp. AF33-28 TaxID=2292046 RepID=UPI000E547C12|nr:prephenate dehydratase [Lachnotalea sp. AF33-28]RHP30264.1 prephenate dehydratase [Lachnotalea sp. AF33-28]